MSNNSPLILAVSMTPNPVEAGKTFVLSVLIEECIHERLEKYTHAQLSVYTHSNLSNDPLK